MEAALINLISSIEFLKVQQGSLFFTTESRPLNSSRRYSNIPRDVFERRMGEGTWPDYLVNRVLTKNKGPHPRKKIYGNREIVVK